MQQLLQVIAIPATLPGAIAVAQVDLNINQGLEVIPDLIAFDNAAFDYVSLVGTTLTVINTGAAGGTTNVYLIYFHTVQRSFGNAQTKQGTPAPFVIRGAGGGGAASMEVVGKMSTEIAQEVADNGSITVAWEIENYTSPVGVVDLANDRFTVPIGGTYIITAALTWEVSGAATGSMRATIAINGAGSGSAQDSVAVEGTNVARSTVISSMFQLAAGDDITLIANQLTGGALDVMFGEMTIARVGPGAVI
jgi:hypothetical protein